MSLFSAESKNWGVDLSAVYQSVNNALHKDLLAFGNNIVDNDFNLDIDDDFCDNFRDTFRSSNIKGVVFDNDTIKEIYSKLKRDALSLLSDDSHSLFQDTLCTFDSNLLNEFLESNPRVWNEKYERAYNELKCYSSDNQYDDIINRVKEARQDLGQFKSDSKVDNIDTGSLTQEKINDIFDYYVSNGFMVDKSATSSEPVSDFRYKLTNKYGCNRPSVDMLTFFHNILVTFGKLSSDNYGLIKKVRQTFCTNDKTLKDRIKTECESVKHDNPELFADFNNAVGKLSSFSACLQKSFIASSTETEVPDIRITHDMFSPYIGIFMYKDENANERSFPSFGIIEFDNGQYVINQTEEYIEKSLNTKEKIKDFMRAELNKLNRSMESSLSAMIPYLSNRNLHTDDKYYSTCDRMNNVFDKYVNLLLSNKFEFMLNALDCKNLVPRFRYDMYIYIWSRMIDDIADINNNPAEKITEMIPSYIHKYKLNINPSDIFRNGDKGTCAGETPSNDPYEKHIYSISRDLYRIINYIHNPCDTFDKYYDVKNVDEKNVYTLTDETLGNENDMKSFFFEVSKRMYYLSKNPNDKLIKDLDSIKDLLGCVIKQFKELGNGNNFIHRMEMVASCLKAGNKVFDNVIKQNTKNDANPDGAINVLSIGHYSYNMNSPKLSECKANMDVIYKSTDIDGYVLPSLMSLRKKVEKLNRTYNKV